jgi:hypothetical protein
MKKRYVFIMSNLLLIFSGSCFSAQAEEEDFSSLDRVSLDAQMKALKTQLDAINKEIKIEEAGKKRDGYLLPLKLKREEFKKSIREIGNQISSLKKSVIVVSNQSKVFVDSEYVDVQDVPLDKDQVAAANAAHEKLAIQARLARVRDSKDMAIEQLERLRELELRYKANSGVLPADTLDELTLLRKQKPELEKSMEGLLKVEEKLEQSSGLRKRPSEEVLETRNLRSQQRRKVQFTENVVAAILHRDDVDAGELQPDLAVAHVAFENRHQGSSRRNAAYTVKGNVVTPLTADGSVVAQLPESDLSELVTSQVKGQPGNTVKK